jgi:transposase
MIADRFPQRGMFMSKRLDRSELEARRIEAGKLLQRGVRPAEVARRLRVSRTSVGRWQQTLTSGGQRSLRGAPRTGRPPLLDANDQKRLIAALKAGALAQGYSSDLWTLGRVGKLIETLTGQRYSESGVWRLLKRLGFSSQRPAKRAMQRDETAVRQWKTKRWPALKKRPPERAGSSSS